MTITQNTILANQTISNNSDIWRRGCANDTLHAREMVIFKRMVDDQNSITFFRVLKGVRLDDLSTVGIEVVDFARFLCHNPGARKVWEERETNLIASREMLGVSKNDFWYNEIKKL